MLTKRYPCASALLVAFSATGYFSAAAADDNESGFYLGAGIGQFDTKVQNIEGLTDAISNFDSEDDTAWKAFVGWRLNKWLSFEAAYIDLGNPRGNFDAAGSDGDYTVELSGFAPYVVGTLPLGIFELSGRVGYYFHDLEINVNFNNIGPGNGDVVGSDESTEAWVYGVGAGVTFFEHLNTKLEYELYDVERMKDTYALWLTGEWRF